jgi:hypothetical protein
MTATKKRLEQMQAEMSQAGQRAVLDLAGAFTEAVRTTADQLRAVVEAASERLAAEQEDFAEDLRQEGQTQREAVECGRLSKQVAAYGDVLRDLAERRRQLAEAKATADPVQRVLADIELRELATKQVRLLVAAGASQAEAEAATATPPVKEAKEALPAPKTEEPNGTAVATPNGKGKASKKATAAKE